MEEIQAPVKINKDESSNFILSFMLFSHVSKKIREIFFL